MKNVPIYVLFLIVFCHASCGQSQSNVNKDNNGTGWLKYTKGVRSILQDSKGNTWFGGYNEGLCLLQNGKLRYFTTENGLSSNQVRSIYEDKNGIIWFVCGRGLSTYDGKELTVYTQRNYNAKNDWKINDNDLWFKGDENSGYNNLEGYAGVYQYDGKQLPYRTFPVTPKLGTGLPYPISTSFVKSKNGTVWFGTYSALVGYDGKEFKIFNNGSLGFNGTTDFLHIRSIMEDSKGNLWIGNNGGIGVLKYDGKEFIHFTEQQHLRKEDTKGNSLNNVFSIAEDPAGNIWFGTNEQGVWRYDGHTLKNFTEKDGVDSGVIWINKSKTGELWFSGGPHGVLRFNGKSFERIY